VKKRAARIHQSQILTGGGPASDEKLTDAEEKLLTITGKVVAEGNSDINESIVLVNRSDFVSILNALILFMQIFIFYII
jgi:hypothetical protein